MIPCREATEEELLLAHTKEHIQSVRERSETGEGVGDMYFTRDTFRAAAVAAGACVDATVGVLEGRAANAFVIARPPAHHAASGAVSGFCFFNACAIAARVALQRGAQRVAIFDWDVHHGDGTQEICGDDPRVLYASVHRHDNGTFFPRTGKLKDNGKAEASGTVLNVPWNGPGHSDADHCLALHGAVLPLVRAFDPDVLIVAAGFDAMAGDPLGGMRLSPAFFAEATARLREAVRGGRVVLALEGGYSLSNLADGAAASLRALLEADSSRVPNRPPLPPPSPEAAAMVSAVLKTHARRPFGRAFRPAPHAVEPPAWPEAGGAWDAAAASVRLREEAQGCGAAAAGPQQGTRGSRGARLWETALETAEGTECVVEMAGADEWTRFVSLSTRRSRLGVCPLPERRERVEGKEEAKGGGGRTADADAEAVAVAEAHRETEKWLREPGAVAVCVRGPVGAEATMPWYCSAPARPPPLECLVAGALPAVLGVEEAGSGGGPAARRRAGRVLWRLPLAPPGLGRGTVQLTVHPADEAAAGLAATTAVDEQPPPCAEACVALWVVEGASDFDMHPSSRALRPVPCLVSVPPQPPGGTPRVIVRLAPHGCVPVVRPDAAPGWREACAGQLREKGLRFRVAADAGGFEEAARSAALQCVAPTPAEAVDAADADLEGVLARLESVSLGPQSAAPAPSLQDAFLARRAARARGPPAAGAGVGAVGSRNGDEDDGGRPPLAGLRCAATVALDVTEWPPRAVWPEWEATRLREIASVTKCMTCLVVLQRMRKRAGSPLRLYREAPPDGGYPGPLFTPENAAAILAARASTAADESDTDAAAPTVTEDSKLDCGRSVGEASADRPSAPPLGESASADDLPCAVADDAASPGWPTLDLPAWWEPASGAEEEAEARLVAALEEVVTVSERAGAARGTTAGLETGEQYTVLELMHGTMLPSGNDAATALAEHFGGDFRPLPDSEAPFSGTQWYAGATSRRDPWCRFVAEMNRAAAALGMTRTRFGNPHGMSHQRHVSCARDAALLVAIACQDPILRDVMGQKRLEVFAWNAREAGQTRPRRQLWANTNKLLHSRVAGAVVVAGKTGITAQAKGCLGTLSTCEGRKVVVVTLGSPNKQLRFVDHQRVLQEAWKRLLQSEEVAVAAETEPRRRDRSQSPDLRASQSLGATKQFS